MLRSREYRQRIAFRKTIEDALYIDAPANMRPLFAEIAVKTGKPKFLTDISPTTLDMMYEEYAPEKWLSKLGAIPYSVVNDQLQHSGSLSDLADAIIAAYRDNWDNIWDAYTAEYKPLDNYNMYQKATYNSSQEHDGDDTVTYSGEEYDIKSGKEINTKSGKEYDIKSGKEINTKSGKEINSKKGTESTVYDSDTENQVSAFNSTTYQDATKAMHSGSDYVSYGKKITGSTSVDEPREDVLEYGTGADARQDTLEFGTGTNERKDTHEYGTGADARQDTLEFGTGNEARKDTHEFGTGADARQDTLEFGTGNDARKDTHSFGTGNDARTDKTAYNSDLKHTGYDELERSGNIGVTTSQQMLQSEIDLRQYNFIMQVFRDITDLIGLPIY